MTVALRTPDPSMRWRRGEAERVREALELLCSEKSPGSRLPNHTELMAHYGASERAVLSALSELQRTGRIIRRPKMGTIVAEMPPFLMEARVTEGLSDSRTVVAVTKMNQAFLGRHIETLIRQVEQHSFSLTCRLVASKDPFAQLRKTSNRRPGGYLLFGTDLVSVALTLRDEGNRVVLMGSQASVAQRDLATVECCHEEGAYVGIEHAIQLGHRHIAAVISEDDPNGIAHLFGHRSAIETAQAEGVTVKYTRLSSHVLEAWRRDPALAAVYFHQTDAPTAVVLLSDNEAIMLLTILLSAGIRVPGDVSLVGYHALPEGTQTQPQLTTIDPGIESQIRVALRMLAQPNWMPKSVLVTPTLTVRESTAPPKQ